MPYNNDDVIKQEQNNLIDAYKRRYPDLGGDGYMQGRDQSINRMQEITDNPVQAPDLLDTTFKHILGTYNSARGADSVLHALGSSRTEYENRQLADRARALSEQKAMTDLYQKGLDDWGTGLKERGTLVKNSMSRINGQKDAELYLEKKANELYTSLVRANTQAIIDQKLTGIEARQIEEEAHRAGQSAVQKMLQANGAGGDLLKKWGLGTEPTPTQVPSPTGGLAQATGAAPEIDPGKAEYTIAPKGVKEGPQMNLVIEQFRKAQAKIENPETRQQGIREMGALQALYPAPQQQPVPQQPPAPQQGAPMPQAPQVPTPQQMTQLPRHTAEVVGGKVVPPRQAQLADKRTQAGDTSYGTSEGKGLYEERKSLSELYSKNQQLDSTLSQMETIIRENPGMPEGAFGPHIQTFRSGLKSLGIEVDKSVPDSQVFDALAKKLALGLKSADGANLLPGAMSNYEDALLQSMAPGLAGTREGNLKLIQLFRETARTNARFGEEATKFASENGDRLTPAWEKRKERIIREEKARLYHAFKNLVGIK